MGLFDATEIRTLSQFWVAGSGPSIHALAVGLNKRAQGGCSGCGPGYSERDAELTVSRPLKPPGANASHHGRVLPIAAIAPRRA